MSVEMSINSRGKPKIRRRQPKRSPAVLLGLILLWSITIGWGLALATNTQLAAQTTAATVGTIDSVPPRLQLGQELYLQNCASCHIAIPPAVLPTQTWQQVLQDSQHYGTQLQLLVDPQRLLVWNYIVASSRPQNKDEDTPYRVDNSRYFKALHPKVKIPRPIQISGCVSCHPGAADYNFRRLTPEWENSQ